jgi:hypothetical protein
MRVPSALPISDCQRLTWLISPARLSNVSRLPNSLMSCAAAFIPIPGTPGATNSAADLDAKADYAPRHGDISGRLKLQYMSAVDNTRAGIVVSY